MSNATINPPETTTNRSPGLWHTGGKNDLVIYSAEGLHVADCLSLHGRADLATMQANAAFIAAAPATAAERDSLKLENTDLVTALKSIANQYGEKTEASEIALAAINRSKQPAIQS